MRLNTAKHSKKGIFMVLDIVGDSLLLSLLSGAWEGGRGPGESPRAPAGVWILGDTTLQGGSRRYYLRLFLTCVSFKLFCSLITSPNHWVQFPPPPVKVHRYY